jgi:hypothetical protein
MLKWPLIDTLKRETRILESTREEQERRFGAPSGSQQSFLRPTTAKMIQGRAKARNIGCLFLGYDNCALAAQQRVLQQNRPIADIRS